MNFATAKKILDSLHEKEFCGGVQLELVKSAEQELGVKFPADYIEYLTKLGCGFASSEDFLGLGGESHLNAARIFKLLREPSKHTTLPADFVPVKPDGYGNYECIDIGRSSKEESTVVLWLHDGGDEQKTEVIAKGLWNWFSKELEAVREFDGQGN